MNKKIIRWLLYIIGILILTLGLTLNTKCELGVSPILSFAFLIAKVTSISFGDITLIYYCIFVLVEYILLKDWRVVLQVPFSIVFTRFLNLFSSFITIVPETMLQKFILLFFAILCTGIGAALTVDVHIVPNPGDGIVSAIAFASKKNMGLIKNIFDFSCITMTFLVGLVVHLPLYGIGIGTLIAMIGVGRVIALFNHLFKEKINQIIQ